ncbi:hypothetical protein ACFRFU_13570 [Streptomyces sp. NPDC056704]|uniref:hypothetical protein n=1 Tax=Streptomyces sp. NPDC056704 TaxID=3345917 RepID=UPI0036A17107
MKGKWYLVKYIDDVFRNEPVNIGVVVASDEGIGTRFLGQREDGSINGQRISKRITGVETYKAWVDFIRREAARGVLEERIQDLSKRVGDSYIIERRGPILNADDSRSPILVADELFGALVSAESAPSPSLEGLAERAFKRLCLPPGKSIDHNVDYKVKVRDVPQLVTFDYRYAAERTTLMDRVSFVRHGKPLMQSVNDLLFRIEAMEKEQGIDGFVALYSGADHSAEVERQLRVLNRYAYTVDLGSDEAEEDIGRILGVSALA